MLGVENGIPRPGLTHAAHVGNDVADFAGFELLRRFATQLQIAHLIDLIQVVAVRPKCDLHPRPDHAVDHANRWDGPAVTVVVRVENQRAQRRGVITARRRHPPHDGLEQLRNAGALFGGDA